VLQLTPGSREGGLLPFRARFPALVSWIVVVESWCPYCVAACESLSEAVGGEMSSEWGLTTAHDQGQGQGQGQGQDQDQGLLVCGMLDLLQGDWECERMAGDGGGGFSVERNRAGARVILEQELGIPPGLPVPFFVPIWRGTHRLDLSLSAASRGMFKVQSGCLIGLKVAGSILDISSRLVDLCEDLVGADTAAEAALRRDPCTAPPLKRVALAL